MDNLWRAISLAFFVVFFSFTTPANAEEQSEIEAVRARLAEVEAEQTRTQALVEDLLKRLETAEANPAAAPSGYLVTEKVISPIEQADVAARGPEKSALFPMLADESRFTLRSADGDFEFGVDGLLVGRAEYNYRSDDGSGNSRHVSGFQTTGTRINFRGHVHGDYGYWARLQADEFGADPIFDALAGIYKFNDDTIMAFGQFPNVLTREQGLAVEKIQAVEASPTNVVFDPFAFKGAILGYHMPRMIVRGIVNDGYRSFANGIDNRPEGPSSDWAFAGQVVGMAIGDESDWDRFNNLTSRRGSDLAWQVDGAFHAQGGPDIYLGIVQSSLEGDGWNLYTAGYYRDTDEEFDEVGGKDLGLVVQGGFWTSKRTEVYGRYDLTRPDSDRPVEGDSFRTITAGLNFYLKPHSDSIKLQGELMYMMDPESESLVQPDTLTSVRASPDGGQFVFRTQAQLRW
jgi:hypothetical protein